MQSGQFLARQDNIWQTLAVSLSGTTDSVAKYTNSAINDARQKEFSSIDHGGVMNIMALFVLGYLKYLQCINPIWIASIWQSLVRNIKGTFQG